MGKATAYYIMHTEKCVAQVSTAGKCKIYFEDFMPYGLVLKESNDFDTRINNVISFHSWCASRLIPRDRTYAKEILNSIGASQSVTDRERAQIALSYHCLSLLDVFWVKGEKENIRFKDINLYTHSLSNALVDIALHGHQMTVKNAHLLANDLSTGGCYPKAWVRKDDGFYLYKDGGQDAVEREVLASKICRCFDCHQVLYEQGMFENEPVSISKIMNSQRYSLVTYAAYDVYCTNHDWNTLDGENLINPQELVERLGPNALVYYADDVDFSREMTLLCKPEKFGCYSGNIRIYLPHPHIDEAADSYRHRIIYAKDIVGNEESVYRMLRRALAQDVHFYEVMFRIEDCKTLNERDLAESKRNEYRQKIEEELLEINARSEEECQNALRTELEKFENERFEWEVEKEKYEEKVRELKEKNHCLRVQESNRQQAVQAEAKNMMENLRNLPQYPKTPEEIADFFEGHFSDRLAFTKKGRNSLQECTTMPEILWDALYQMATKLYDLYTDAEVKSVENAFNNASNLRMARCEGKMTRKDSSLMRQYEDEYEGRRISIEPHVKTSENKESSPKFLRVYFCFDDISKKIVIGSCGKHLNNYTTRKI